MFPDRLLLTAEAGLENAGGGSTGDPAPTPAPVPNGAPPQSWYAPAEVLKTANPDVWQSFENAIKSGAIKDLPSLVVKGISAEKKLGSALSLPNKDKPEEVSAFKAKLYEAGLLTAPPESPDKYEIKLDSIPESMRSESTVQAVRDWAHKHGLSNQAVTDLMQIEEQRYNETVKPIIEIDRKQSQQEFDSWALGIGKESKALQAYGGAWLRKNLTEEQVQRLEATGLGDHPALLKLVAKAGMDTGEDISEIAGTGDPTADAEFQEIMKMTSDPKHPDYQVWMKGNPQSPERIALQERYNAAFRRKYGTGEVK